MLICESSLIVRICYFLYARAHDQAIPYPMQVPKEKTATSNLSRDSGLGVRNLNTEFLCASDNVNSLPWRNGVGDPVSISPTFLQPDLKITYSAAKVLLCIRRRSTSRTLLTRKALWPEGIMWRVFLFDPKPIYSVSISRYSHLGAELQGVSQNCFGSRPESPQIFQRTDGITIWPLNRLRTLLSIPFGFLHEASTHL